MSSSIVLVVSTYQRLQEPNWCQKGCHDNPHLIGATMGFLVLGGYPRTMTDGSDDINPIVGHLLALLPQDVDNVHSGAAAESGKQELHGRHSRTFTAGRSRIQAGCGPSRVARFKSHPFLQDDLDDIDICCSMMLALI
jgi:hypothetical protein